MENIESRKRVKVSETNDIRELSNHELQRLVLLEQLKYFRAKNKILAEKCNFQSSQNNQQSTLAAAPQKARSSIYCSPFDYSNINISPVVSFASDGCNEFTMTTL